jgi:hypothetical protein
VSGIADPTYGMSHISAGHPPGSAIQASTGTTSFCQAPVSTRHVSAAGPVPHRRQYHRRVLPTLSPVTLVLVAVVAALIVALVIATAMIVRLANLQAEANKDWQCADAGRRGDDVIGPELEPSSPEALEEKTVVGWTERSASSRYA